jgi:hypothetical protein
MCGREAFAQEAVKMGGLRMQKVHVVSMTVEYEDGGDAGKVFRGLVAGA